MFYFQIEENKKIVVKIWTFFYFSRQSSSSMQTQRTNRRLDRREINWDFNQLLDYQGVVDQKDRHAVKIGSRMSLCIHKLRRNFEHRDKLTNLSFAISVFFTRVNNLGYHKIAIGDTSNSVMSRIFWKAECACLRITHWRLVVNTVR